MKVKQISVFVENTTGRLAEVTRILAKEKINLRAASIADTADFGIFRFVAEEPQKALDVLHKSGFTAKATEVIGVEVDDSPGGLEKILSIFEKDGVNIEYLYSSLIETSGRAVVIFKVEDINHGLEIVEKNGLKAIEAF